MRTITFYSYKGGVGRTLAAANFAVYLAEKLGQRTVVIDFDLEAPGIDAKFPLLELPEEQKGVLDYILEYQIHNRDPGSIEEISLPIPLEGIEKDVPLWLIPAGQYLSEDYYRKLSQLDWGVVFSEQRNGVEFFQQFLARIERELQADFVIIDSRTGITEISGLCTQQLADEVVMLSSMSTESIRVTKFIKQLIQDSHFAKVLEKEIDIKLVISRIPKPDDLIEFKKKSCATFQILEEKIFFLFSSSHLEQEEFLAISNSEKDEELLNSYIRLFYGLNLELADKNIIQEIEKISSRILSLPVEQSKQEILELVASYPHPEIYRMGMRFFALCQDTHYMLDYGWKLFNVFPDDEEAQKLLFDYYINRLETNFIEYEDYFESNNIEHYDFESEVQKCLEKVSQILEYRRQKSIILLKYIDQNKKLTIQQEILYSIVLFSLQEFEKSSQIASQVFNTLTPQICNGNILKSDKDPYLFLMRELARSIIDKSNEEMNNVPF
ncbi:MAG: AAA family ATPase [Cyanobacteria bacterium P01_E01_bin.42]